MVFASLVVGKLRLITFLSQPVTSSSVLGLSAVVGCSSLLSRVKPLAKGWFQLVLVSGRLHYNRTTTLRQCDCITLRQGGYSTLRQGDCITLHYGRPITLYYNRTIALRQGEYIMTGRLHYITAGRLHYGTRMHLTRARVCVCV